MSIRSRALKREDEVDQLDEIGYVGVFPVKRINDPTYDALS